MWFTTSVRCRCSHASVHIRDKDVHQREDYDDVMNMHATVRLVLAV